MAGGGCGPWGGVCVVRGGSPCQTPPVNRMTDRCKNITLAKTSFRPVIKCVCENMFQAEKIAIT